MTTQYIFNYIPKVFGSFRLKMSEFKNRKSSWLIIIYKYVFKVWTREVEYANVLRVIRCHFNTAAHLNYNTLTKL